MRAGVPEKEGVRARPQEGKSRGQRGYGHSCTHLYALACGLDSVLALPDSCFMALSHVLIVRAATCLWGVLVCLGLPWGTNVDPARGLSRAVAEKTSSESGPRDC